MAIPSGRAATGRMHPDSFVVRLWADTTTQPAQPEWRFHVLHVQSGKEAYGRTFAELKRIVESWTAQPGPDLAADGDAPPARAHDEPS